MEVKYRLEKLNEVQFAHDENRRKELEEKGFKLVNTADEAAGGVKAENKKTSAKAAGTTEKSGKKAKAEEKTGSEEGENKNVK